MTFDGDKYKTASDKALSFIKRQLDVNNFKFSVSFDQAYSDYYSGDVISGTVNGLNPDEDQVFPKYINVDTYYDYAYKGKVHGTWHDISDYQNYAVNVYVIRDANYKVISCPLKADGTWESTMDYKEIYTIKDEGGGSHTETSEYRLDVNVGEGVKVFYLGKNLTDVWETLTHTLKLTTIRHVYNAPDELSDEEGGNVYSYFAYYTVRLYTYSDAEYLNSTCKIYRVSSSEYIWYTNKVAEGHKIGKVMHQVWRNGETQYDVVGIAGSITNLQKGRLPASFLIPEDDPQYNKDGSNALGAYGYMLNSRTWAYDVGLALLVFTTSGDYDICKEMLTRMNYEQNSDGSFNFSYDIYIGQLFDGYVRTGALGWLIWGACYYTLESGDRSFVEMIKKAGDFLISRQITNTNDPRYGLMAGGYGAYNMEDYSYSGVEIEWCSTEHQCSALQGLEGCALVLKDKKYKQAAELVRDQLYIKCFDKKNGRFYQGINSGKPDQAWALDCTTWAGSLAFSIVCSDAVKSCFDTAKKVYLTQGKSIISSSEKDYYNTVYSSNETFSGFKPYSDKTSDYAGAPDIVWTEGTLGYSLLAIILGNKEEAQKYVDECIRLQNIDASTGGVIYTTATYGMLPWEFHVWESVVSSSWLYLIINNPDILFPRTLRQVFYMTKITNMKDERP